MNHNNLEIGNHYTPEKKPTFLLSSLMTKVIDLNEINLREKEDDDMEAQSDGNLLFSLLFFLED